MTTQHKFRKTTCGSNITLLRAIAPYCLTNMELALCEDVINQPIVGAFGLPQGKNEISVKGDPSLRETAMLRPRQESRLDRKVLKVLAACEFLLRKTGIYAVYIGFNSNEIRTESIFNPFNYEIHDAEALITEGYLERHFIRVPYNKKLQAVHKLRGGAQTGKLRKYLPKHWRVLLDEERDNWQLLDKAQLTPIMAGLYQLRQIEDFYLRNAYISLSQNLVRAAFNCDGMYIVKADEFPRFVAETV